MDFLLIQDGMIANIIVAEPDVAAELGAVPAYAGARIGGPYPPIPTPAQQRETAYDTDPLIQWQGKSITVTEAARLWTYYTSEGDAATATALTEQIAAAKAEIRARYPDVPEADTGEEV